MTVPYSAITHDSRHPFETYILTACVIGGTFALLGDLFPASLQAAFPSWVERMWGIGFAGGAALALTGINATNRKFGIFMEQIGLINVAATCFTYAAAILVYQGADGIVVAALFILIGAASVRQWGRLEKFVRDSIRFGARMKRIRNGR